jgi:SAM-dependent methyltransferase
MLSSLISTQWQRFRARRTPAPPLAPPELRGIVAAVEPDVFTQTGEQDLALMLALYRKHAANIPGRPRVLDFGCGCGRLTRFLDADPSYETFACDLNPQHVAWCNTHLRNVTTRVNRPVPPLPFDDATIDCAYLVSVFTHLTLAAARDWIADLARVIAPGGVAIITTHGPTALSIIRDSSVHHEMFRLDARRVDDILARLPTERHIFLAYAADVVAMANVGTEYGNSFMHPSGAADWGGPFDMVDSIPGGLRGWHDVYVLSKPAGL